MVATAVDSEMTVLPGDGWLGHLASLREDPLKMVSLGANTGADIVRLRLGPIRAFVVYGPDAIREVLVERPDRFGRQTRGSKLLRRTLGLSTLTSEGDEWRWRRRLAQPSFKRDALDRLDRAITDAAARVADQMLASEGPVDVSASMSALALDVACFALFGDDLGEDAPIVHRALTEVLEGYMPFATHPIPNLDRLPIPAATRYWRAREELAGVVGRIVERRKARGDAAEGSDLLAALISGARPDGTPLTASDLDAEGVTMLLAGHETTANAMSFTLGLLGKHPMVRRRLERELRDVLGDRPATAADLPKLPFLDAVVREGMRLFPPAWVVSRSTSEPVTIAGHAVPQGAFLYVPVYAVHRLPRFWDDPEGFDPERWLDGRAEVARKAGAYLPFGMGQRRCIGEHLGMLEARLVLATLVRKVTLELRVGQALEPEVSVTLRPKGGLWVNARRVAASGGGARTGADDERAVGEATAEAAGCPFHHGSA